MEPARAQPLCWLVAQVTALVALSLTAASCQATRTDTATMEPSRQIHWGPSERDLRLGLAFQGAQLSLVLENQGSDTRSVASHVQAHEKHLDWFTITLRTSAGTMRTIAFSDERRRSAIIAVSLAPGQRLEQEVDINTWAARAVNGGEPIAPDRYEVIATYDVADSGEYWQGRLHSSRVVVSLP